jgi:hypothetical protein
MGIFFFLATSFRTQECGLDSKTSAKYLVYDDPCQFEIEHA